jgi:membrane protein implicated in regulation of membrane protease activity
MELITAPEVRPFAIALVVLLGLLVIEVVSLLAGLSAGSILDKAIDLDADADGEASGWLSGALGWLNAGRVPVLVLLMLLLAGFAATGYLVQGIAGSLAAPLPVVIAAGVAIVAALPVARQGSRLVARLVPQDETYAVENADLVGRVAEVTLGPLDEGRPGRIKVLDAHGNWHFLPARAAPGTGPFATGAPVLLVDRDAASFLVIAPGADLSPRPELSKT